LEPGESKREGRRVFGLLKFGEHKYMEALRTRGSLYLNTIGYFQKLEDTAGRADRDEGLEAVYHPSTIGRLQVGNIIIPPGDLVGPVRVAYDDSADLNIYCLYGASETPTTVDPRCQQFGDAFVVIKNVAEFMKRLTTKLSELHLESEVHTVDYVDKLTYSGRMGPFRKYSEFAYQAEIRILVGPGTGKALSIDIGSLEDISELHRIVKDPSASPT
jgi:hypothetical protein